MNGSWRIFSPRAPGVAGWLMNFPPRGPTLRGFAPTTKLQAFSTPGEADLTALRGKGFANSGLPSKTSARHPVIRAGGRRPTGSKIPFKEPPSPPFFEPHRG